MTTAATTRRIADMIVSAIDGAEVLTPQVAQVHAEKWSLTDDARVVIHLTDGTAWVADVQRARGLDRT